MDPIDALSLIVSGIQAGQVTSLQARVEALEALQSTGSPLVQADSYIIPGSYSWTLLPTSKWVYVTSMGGGGGGGGGRKGVNTTLRFGGRGGASGAPAIFMFPAELLRARGMTSLIVQVGAGGLGAPRQTTNSTDGIPGAGGNRSVFGQLLRAGSGRGGGGGTSGAGSAEGGFGNDGSRTGAQWFSDVNGLTGGNGGGAGAGSAASTNSSVFAKAGGGGGGCSAGNAEFNGGAGGGVAIGGALNPLDTVIGLRGLPGGAGGTTAGVPPGDGTSAGEGVPLGGAGGGGGASSAAGDAQTGGHGALYGAGGGGGGAASDGAGNAGGGGNGAGGFVHVVQF